MAWSVLTRPGLIGSGLIWSGLLWPDLVWPDLVWPDLVWPGLIWSGLVWLGLVWFGMVWSGLIWSGLPWPGLAWFGLVWLGLVCSGLLWCVRGLKSICQLFKHQNLKTCQKMEVKLHTLAVALYSLTYGPRHCTQPSHIAQEPFVFTHRWIHARALFYLTTSIPVSCDGRQCSSHRPLGHCQSGPTGGAVDSRL